ncbi:unnamed protein product [Gadus morhua 'NCC']
MTASEYRLVPTAPAAHFWCGTSLHRYFLLRSHATGARPELRTGSSGGAHWWKDWELWESTLCPLEGAKDTLVSPQPAARF